VVKVVIAYGLLLLFLNRVRTISRISVFFLLFILWSFAYLYSPYWHAFGTFGFPNLKYVTFVFLLLFGLLWAFVSARNVKLPKIKIHPFSLFVLITSLYVVNFKQLSADIPWRGDEEFHINRVLDLAAYLSFFHQFSWLVILLPATFIIYYFFRKKIVWFISIVLSALFLFPSNAFTTQTDILLLVDILRYPFIQKWVNFFFVIPNYYDISSYRIVPFLSLVGIASFLFYIFNKQLKSQFLAFLFAFAFSTVPLLLFYSSILYLEMPIVFLILVSICNIQILIKEGADKLKHHYVWYALLLLSFLEESALIFLLLILTLRIIYQMLMQYKARGVLKPLFSEGKLSMLILGPIVTYMLFRIIFLSYYWSSFSFYINNIFSVDNYIETMRSLIFQTGALPIIAVLGLIILSKKNIFVTRAIVLVFAGILVFFLIYLHRSYVGPHGETLLVGYSRYPNLYLLPLIFFAATVFVSYIARRGSVYAVVLLIVIFAFNIILFPFKSDGARLPNWGSENLDTAEYTYPYDDAIRYLSGEKTDTLLLLGQYSPYWGLRYYLEKYNYHPKIHEYPFGSVRFDEKKERQMFNSFFKNPPISADTILYHSVNNIDLDTNIVYGKRFKIVKRVQNSLHSLYILRVL